MGNDMKKLDRIVTRDIKKADQVDQTVCTIYYKFRLLKQDCIACPGIHFDRTGLHSRPTITRHPTGGPFSKRPLCDSSCLSGSPTVHVNVIPERSRERSCTDER